jgi:RNA polymerase-interacting CarD/CdnL/TRCF family regulator
MMQRHDLGSGSQDAPQAPPPDTHAAGALPLAVGDRVVYASHGIGRVESTQRLQGDPSETLTLAFDSGLKVTLPLTRAQAALRALSSEAELDEVRRMLQVVAPPVVEPWSRRHRRLQSKLVGGSISGLAEIVRDGIQRERRRVKGKGGPAPIENQLYRRARTLLVAEIAAARSIEPDVADAWISQQVCDEASAPYGKCSRR